MDVQTIFQRYEIKYFLTTKQLQHLKECMQPYMEADAHGKSTILNLYFDTPNDLLIRHSLEKPVYKEKLRLRSYHIPDGSTPVFLEIKKKYDSVVYKRPFPHQRCLRQFIIAGKYGINGDKNRRWHTALVQSLLK